MIFKSVAVRALNREVVLIRIYFACLIFEIFECANQQ